MFYLKIFDAFVLVFPLLTSTQPAITCLKITIETLEQGVKYAQS